MKVTLEHVAQHAGVSRRTVDRVVNNRGNVRPEVEKRIREALKTLNYQPNKLASSLAYSKYKKKVGILYQEDGFRNFDDNIARGIRDASSELDDFGIVVEVAHGDVHDPAAYLKEIDRLIEEGVCGLAMRGADIPELVQKIDELADKGIPVVTFNSDIPKSKRVRFVGQELYQSGRIAGNLMAKMVRFDEKIVIGCGVPEYHAHRSRVDGFVYEMKKHGFDEEQWQVFHSEGSYDSTYRCLEEIFSENDDIRGIYMSVEPNNACGDFLRKKNLKRRPFVICHDAFEENVKYLKDDIFDFIIDQNIYRQGYQSLLELKDILMNTDRTDEKQIVSDLTIYDAVSVGRM